MENPLPVFRFDVDWGDGPMPFAEVSGLTMEVQPIEYRHGMQKDQVPLQIPGLKKFGNITLKRGMAPGEGHYFDWINTALLNTIEKRDLTIAMFDAGDNPVVTWRVLQAWPVKIEGPGLKASGNEVAIESMELAHGGFAVEFA